MRVNNIQQNQLSHKAKLKTQIKTNAERWKRIGTIFRCITHDDKDGVMFIKKVDSSRELNKQGFGFGLNKDFTFSFFEKFEEGEMNRLMSQNDDYEVAKKFRVIYNVLKEQLEFHKNFSKWEDIKEATKSEKKVELIEQEQDLISEDFFLKRSCAYKKDKDLSCLINKVY